VTDSEKANYKAYIAAWRRAAPLLEAQRDADIRAADTVSSILSMNLLFQDALKNFPPEPYSGLVEQQRWFKKLHRR
jgi:hypothetical protein